MSCCGGWSGATAAPTGSIGPELAVPHGTTVVAVRYADGVVMAGDRRATAGQLHQPPVDREGVPRRPLVRRGHRRGGRAGDGDGEAVPTPARALREGRRRTAQPGGQGQPAGADGAQPPAGRHAGAGRGAAVRRLRPPSPSGAPLPVRRHRRALRGGRLRHVGLGRPPRGHRGQARLPRRRQPRRHGGSGAEGAVRGGRRGLGHRRARSGAGHLPHRGHHHRRRVRAGGRRGAGRALEKPHRRRDGGARLGRCRRVGRGPARVHQ